LADTNFPSEKNFEVENFQLLTMIFWENFLSMENFPQKESFVKCDWPKQIFRLKKILKLKIFNFKQ
jgi:hypothetical protein